MRTVPVNTPLFSGNEKKYLAECIDSGWISSEGPMVAEFEQKFAATVSRRYGIAVANGTAALDIAVEALEINEGDEVIMPTFTIISCVAQVLRKKAKPIFIDAELETWNMNVAQIERKITDRTKAILIVHIYGFPADIEPILKLASKYNLRVIEDAAEMIGQTYQNKICGSFGDISTFSFYPNKHLTTGEGGMVVTDDIKIAEKCRSLRNLCFQQSRRFVHSKLGWNYRMTSLQAAIGLAQLEQLKKFIKLKRELGRHYTELLSGTPGLVLPLQRMPYAENIYWVYYVLVDKKTGYTALEVCRLLSEKGIGTRPAFYPLHAQPLLQDQRPEQKEGFPIAELIAEQGFYLPSGLATTPEDRRYVAEKLREIMNSVGENEHG